MMNFKKTIKAYTIHPTRLFNRKLSTRGGMRRILKQRLGPLEFIKCAVETGVYKGLPSNSPANEKNYFRNRKKTIDKYPVEYDILRLNPPLPQPQILTKKMQKEQQKKAELANPVNKYVKRYMERYDAKTQTTRPIRSKEQDENEHYRKMLGVPKSSSLFSSAKAEDMNTRMGRKAPVLKNAYEFALKQYEFLQTNDAMTEKESIAAVEKLLEKERREETLDVRDKAQKVSQWRKDVDGVNKSSGNVDGDSGISSEKTTSLPQGEDELKEKEKIQNNEFSTPPHSTVPSILSSKPRTIRALDIWGKRLKAVPYNQWTLGATTALDHWIAVEVLGMQEKSWDSLLDSTSEDVAGKGMDIISVRSNLFPETVIDSIASLEDDMDSMEDGQFHESDEAKKEYLDATDRSIDELLASLRGFDEDENSSDVDNAGTQALSEEDSESSDLDTRISNMVDELQEWRAKNQELSFQNWDLDTKKEFNEWLLNYLEVVAPEAESGEIDLDATREAILSSPPESREETDTFWSRMRDETEAEIFLEELRQNFHSLKPENNEDEEQNAKEKRVQDGLEAFINMPYSKQLRHLINIGTLRPILDEFAKESDRLKFIKQYGEILLEGIQMEHLVSDPNGTITIRDIGDDSIFKGEDINQNERFSIEMIPYGTNEFGTTRSERARELYKVWNIQKAGKAKYEEHLFKKGKRPLKEV